MVAVRPAQKTQVQRLGLQTKVRFPDLAIQGGVAVKRCGHLCFCPPLQLGVDDQLKDANDGDLMRRGKGAQHRLS